MSTALKCYTAPPHNLSFYLVDLFHIPIMIFNFHSMERENDRDQIF